MEAYQAVILAVVALLVGALLPVVFQLTATLRAVRAVATQAGPAIASITATAERLERLTARLEEGGRINRALEAVDTLSRIVAKLQDTAHVASTVAATVIPAAAAAVQAWRTWHEEGGADPPGEGPPAPSAAGPKEEP
jgi:hypothetical protein